MTDNNKKFIKKSEANESLESQRINENFPSDLIKKNLSAGNVTNTQNNNTSNLMIQNTQSIKALLDQLKKKS